MASILPNLPRGDLEGIKRAFFRWLGTRKKGEKVSFLLTGKTGVGKSRLVNALVGERVAEEGQKKDPCTSTVNSYSVTIEGTEVLVWDSPGLQDGTRNEDSYMADLTKKLEQGIDIMIYCLKMDDRRFHEDDKRAMLKLTRLFGNKLWKNAVIALTFANRVKDPDGITKGDKQSYFMRDLAEWQEAIKKFLTSDLMIDLEQFQAIPIVPAGNYHKLRLPNCENWLSELWTQCYCVMKDSGALNLYRINKKRVKFPGSEKMAVACGSPEDETLQTCSSTAGSSHRMSAPAFSTKAGTSQTTSSRPQYNFYMKDNAVVNLHGTKPGPTNVSGSEKMASACVSPGNETRQTFKTTTGTQRVDPTSDIPREIPFNHKQGDSFLKKTWNMFTRFLSSGGSGVGSAVKSVAKVAWSVGKKILGFIFD